MTDYTSQNFTFTIAGIEEGFDGMSRVMLRSKERIKLKADSIFDDPCASLSLRMAAEDADKWRAAMRSGDFVATLSLKQLS